jgi:hypothetical protein
MESRAEIRSAGKRSSRKRLAAARRALLCVGVLLSCAHAATSWTPAIYHGLALGRAHRAEVVRALGEPSSTSRGPLGEELHYTARGEHKGDLTLRLDRSGTVYDIEEEFPRNIPRTILYREFGKNAVTAHFSQAACASNALYRDPRGQIELTMYPERGIVLWPNQEGYDFATVHYMAREPGVPRPACAPR